MTFVRTFLSLATIYSWNGVLIAQEDSVVFKGQKAIMFQIGSNLTLQPFDGYLVSYKRHVSAKKAWRVGVSFSGYHTEGEEIYFDSNFSIVNDDYSNANFTITVSLQKMPGTGHPVRFYYGYGGRFGIEHVWRGSEIPLNITEYGDRIRIGSVGYLGVEWILTPNFVLSGEYGAQLYYSIFIQRVIFPDGRFERLYDHTIGFSPDGARLGLSIYFE